MHFQDIESKFLKENRRFISLFIKLECMLTRILDTSQIDMNDIQIRAELDIDLQRMDKLPHDRAPNGSNAYKVAITPGHTYTLSCHQFDFQLQYGILKKDKFTSMGEPVKYTTELLP